MIKPQNQIVDRQDSGILQDQPVRIFLPLHGHVVRKLLITFEKSKIKTGHQRLKRQIKKRRVKTKPGKQPAFKAGQDHSTCKYCQIQEQSFSIDGPVP